MLHAQVPPAPASHLPASLPSLLPTILPTSGLIGKNLDLKRGGNRYIKTAAYGHFGRDDLDVFTW